MATQGPQSKRPELAAQSAEDALVLEVVDDEGGVELVFSSARVPGRLVGAPTFLLPASEHEVVVVVADEPVGVAVRVVVGCAVSCGAVARVVFIGLDVAGCRLPQSTPPAPPALSGRLDEVPLVDVVQLVCVARRDAAIGVRFAGGGGVILCSAGRAVYAATDAGAEGETAFFSLVGAGAGSFAVRYGVTVAAENLGGDTTWLLLEAMRRLDEAGGGVVPVLDDGGASSTSARATMRDVLASMPIGERAPSRDEEHVVEPVLTPRELRRHSQPPTPPMTTPMTSAVNAPAPRSAPAAAEWPPLPSRATGRFARFFDELSEVTKARPTTTSLPPVDDLGGDDDDRVDVVAALFDSDDGPAVDDDATARLRFASLQVKLAGGDETGERDTEIVRSSRNLST